MSAVDNLSEMLASLEREVRWLRRRIKRSRQSGEVLEFYFEQVFDIERQVQRIGIQVLPPEAFTPPQQKDNHPWEEQHP